MAREVSILWWQDYSDQICSTSCPYIYLCGNAPPKGTSKLIEKYFARFFWGVGDEKDKYHWSSWANLCLPKEERGIGLKRLEDISDSFAYKGWWNFRTQ